MIITYAVALLHLAPAFLQTVTDEANVEAVDGKHCNEPLTLQIQSHMHQLMLTKSASSEVVVRP